MELKSQNKNITNLLRFINFSEGSNKLEIAENIMVSPAALTKISKKLVADNILIEEKKIDDKGRKKNILLINYERFLSIGVLIGAKIIEINITNLKNENIYSFEMENNYKNNFEKFSETIVLYIKKIVEESLIPLEKILGVGVVISNDFIIDNSIMLFKEDKFAKFKELVMLHLKKKVYIESQIRALALYKAFLNPKYKNFFLIKYDDIRGSSIIVDSNLLNPVVSHYRSMGNRHFIVEPNSEIYCDICKKRGCFETMVAPKYLFQEILKENNYSERIRLLYEKMSFEEFIERAEKGEVLECKTLRKVAKYIAILIINHNNFLPLDTFLLSGKVFKSQLFISYLKMYLQEFQLAEVHEKLIVLDADSDEEKKIGSFLAINYIFYNYHLDISEDTEEIL
ncbi:ROK family transcriptional regulator [Cetobacterium sp. 8H]|uniref:ROK family transcriptional regulator n=1 Tax=Cetobacterium sp. 8H TaxID=2759681 RepID=UPI00163C28E4|nr:ROK family transcriptional regulator [Cetobacterium sp. 8H]MBC2851005.1 ROK family transcriptional regulator [Cetobacterium sp. 8H]